MTTATRTLSHLVCRRCGLPVHLWGSRNGTYWKHCAGWRSKPSCGKKPDPVERSAWEAAVRRSFAGAKS